MAEPLSLSRRSLIKAAGAVAAVVAAPRVATAHAADGSGPMAPPSTVTTPPQRVLWWSEA